MASRTKNPPVRRKLAGIGTINRGKTRDQIVEALVGLEPVFLTIPGTEAILCLDPLTSTKPIHVGDATDGPASWPACYFARVSVGTPEGHVPATPHAAGSVPAAIPAGITDYGLVRIHLVDIVAQGTDSEAHARTVIRLETNRGPVQFPIEVRDPARRSSLVSELGIGRTSEVAARFGSIALRAVPDTFIEGELEALGTEARGRGFADMAPGTYDVMTADGHLYTVVADSGTLTYLDHAAVRRGENPAFFPATDVTLSESGRLTITFAVTEATATTPAITEERTTALVTAIGRRTADDGPVHWLQAEAQASQSALQLTHLTASTSRSGPPHPSNGFGRF